MRWGCPHCGVQLTLSDDKMGAGWAFSKCHSCGGFALIRRSEISVIKVDRAPSGENVLTPESEQASIIAMAAPSVQMPVPMPVLTPAPVASAPIVISAPAATARLPDPLPELSVPKAEPARVGSGLISAAIGIAAAMTLLSGAYLFLEGRAIWEKAHPQVTTPAAAPQPAPKTAVIQAPPISDARVETNRELVDQVRERAMAPVRVSAPTARAGLLVEPREDEVKFRSGPGLEFPIIATSEPGVKFNVLDWNDRWFKVQLPDSREAAWVRKDVVKLTTR